MQSQASRELVKSDRIKRALGEIAIVVVGILLAFGVDSAWETAQDRRIAAEVVSGIHTAFQNNREYLEGSSRRRQQKLEATRELLLMSSDPQYRLTPDSVAVLVRMLRIGRGFRPDDSRLEELIVSGRMHLIRDEELRALIAGWPRRVQAKQNLEAIAHDHTRLAIGPWLRQRIPTPGGPGRLDQLPPPPLTDTDVDKLRSMEFANLLRDLYFYEQNSQNGSALLLELVDEMTGLLAAERD